MTKFNIDFASKFKGAGIVSVVFVIASFSLLFSRGLNFGVDFKGGAEVQVKFDQKLELKTLREEIKAGGLNASSVQSIGNEADNEFMIKIGATDNDVNKVTDSLTALLTSKFADQGATIRKTDIVGPKAGEQLRISGFQAMAWALLVIMIYIALRFDYKYSPGAIIATFHDVIIILGVFALTQKEFSLQIVGALLAVIGYSVNDTVVVYDRVREYEDRNPQGKLAGIINSATNETLPRTILTSITTLFVSLTMFFMGGGIIHDFFFAITLGILVGTYSSVFVAAPTIMFFDRFKFLKG